MRLEIFCRTSEGSSWLCRIARAPERPLEPHWKVMGEQAGRWFPLYQPARRNWPLHAGRSKGARPLPGYGSVHTCNLCESTLRDMSPIQLTTIPTRGPFFSSEVLRSPSRGPLRGPGEHQLFSSSEVLQPFDTAKPLGMVFRWFEIMQGADSCAATKRRREPFRLVLAFKSKLSSGRAESPIIASSMRLAAARRER